MIYMEGCFIDPHEGILTARITCDTQKQRAVLEIKDKPGRYGKVLAKAGVSGPGAERFYIRTTNYYFGHDRKADSCN